MNPILALARPEILTLQPYQHAAWEPSLERLHANEMPWRASQDATAAGLNRYPEPQPAELVAHLAALYGVQPENVLVGRGSDEGIDLLVRAFCRAGQDSVMICPPTFGMYKVSARIQGAGVIEVPLDPSFDLDPRPVLAAWQPGVKLVFLCTPNNPTGGQLALRHIHKVCEELADRAVVVIDEAYAEFCERPSLIKLMPEFPNVVILRTLSKAYAMAGARCGTVLAQPDIIELLGRVITPYALATPTIEAALRFTDAAHCAEARQRIERVRAERERLRQRLPHLPLVRKVWPSDANFLLVECTDAQRVLQAAIGAGLIIRDPRSQPRLAHCLRISIGTPEQNDRLVSAIAAASGQAA